jgi:hypothetical protein
VKSADSLSPAVGAKSPVIMAAMLDVKASLRQMAVVGPICGTGAFIGFIDGDGRPEESDMAVGALLDGGRDDGREAGGDAGRELGGDREDERGEPGKRAAGAG